MDGRQTIREGANCGPTRRRLLQSTAVGVAGLSAGTGIAAGREGERRVRSRDPEVVSASVRHVDGTEPVMDDVVVVAEVRGNHVMVHVDALDRERQSETDEELPRRELRTADLTVAGADRSTTFEVDLVLESFAPRLLVGRSRGLQWERESRDDGTVAVTVAVSPAEKQTNGDDPQLDDWPEGEDDRATHGVSQNVSFAVRSLADHDDALAERLDGTVVGSNAQVIGTPALRRDGEDRPRFEITVAAPHYTASGDVYDGFYYTVLSPSLLDAWDVSDPEQLSAWYDGDDADFAAERVDDAILVEVDVHYSVATVAVGRGEGGPDEESDDGGGSETDRSGEESERPPDGDDDGDEGGAPGFGALGALAGLGGLGYLLGRRRGDDQ